MNSNTFRYICASAWVLLIGLLPFIVTSSTYFPFIVGKNLFFRAIVDIILVLWLASCITNKELRPKWSWLLGIFAGFTLWVGIADVMGINSLRSFWSNFERMEGYITILHLFALFLVSASCLTKDLWYKLIGWSVVVSGFTWIQGMVEHLKSPTARIDGSFGNAIYFAAYALIHMFFAALLACRYRDYRYLWIIFGIANLITIFYTGTRGALLGFIAGAILALIIFIAKQWKHTKIRNVSLTVFGVIIAGVIALGLMKDTKFTENSPILYRFSDMAHYLITFDVNGILENAGRARIAIWGIAWEGVKERPLTGWGQDNFLQVFSKYYDPAIFDQEQWFDRTHNVFFDWLIAAGFIGLVGYLGIFAAMLWYVWKRDGFADYEKIILTGLVAAYFVHTFFVFDNITTYIFIMLILALVQHEATAHMHIEHAKVQKRRDHSEAVPLLATLGVVGGCILAWFMTVPVFATSNNLIKGLMYAQGDGTKPSSDAFIKESRAYFEKALSGSQLAQTEVYEAMVNASYNIKTSAALPETKTEFLIFIGNKLNEYVAAYPEDVRALYFAGIYFNSIGNYERAAEVLTHALSVSESKQTVMFLLADTYTKMNKKPEALELFRRAYEVAPAFLEPKLQYAGALIAANRTTEANELVKDIPSEALHDKRFTGILIALKRYDVLIDLYQAEAEKNPGNIQARISLAAVYVEAGRRGDAIKVLEGIMKDVPEAKKDLEYFISEIRAGRNPVQK